MRSPIFAAAIGGAIVLAAVAGGAIYLSRSADDQNTASVAAPAQRATAGGAQGGAASVPVPPPARNAVPPLQVPQPLAETFGEWRVWCTLDVQSRENCRAEQVLKDQDGKSQLAVVAYPAAGGAPARLRLVPPWGVLIEAGLAVRVDAMPVMQVPIKNCLPTGCQAELILSDGLLKAMQTGKELRIGVTTADRKPISTSVQLAGFSDAYSRIADKTAR